MANNKSSGFDEANIQVLDGIAHVRKRPGMYWGGTDARSLHYMVFTVITLLLQDRVTLNCKVIKVRLQQNTITISGDDEGMADIQDNMTNTTKHYPPPENSVFSHGVGLAAVNAMCSQLTTESKREGKLHRQQYEKGRPITPVETIRDLEMNEATGTTITFTPDSSIMPTAEFDYQTIRRKLREWAFLLPDHTFQLDDEVFHCPYSLADYINYLNRDLTPLHELIHHRFDINLPVQIQDTEPYTITYDIALQYVEEDNSLLLSYANAIMTDYGGPHAKMFEGEIIDWIERHVKLPTHYNYLTTNLTLLGLTAIIHVFHPDPQFESKAMLKLMNPDVDNPEVRETLQELLDDYAENHPDDMQRIMQHIMKRKASQDHRIYGG